MSCWIVSDGRAGNEKQCLAVTHYMPVEPEVFRLKWAFPWNITAPHLLFAAQYGLLKPAFSQWKKTGFPKVAIGAGKRGALALRLIKSFAPDCFTTQILNPRIDREHFDLVVTPRHDGLNDDNVVNTLGSLHNVDDDTMAIARETFAPLLAHYPQPRVVLLIGATNRAATIDEKYFTSLMEPVNGFISKHGGSLLVTASGRTDPAIRAYLSNELDSKSDVYFWHGEEDGPNPYMGYLAYADKIVVTPDSVNMLSEALGTGKPVYSTATNAHHARLHSFHNYMVLNKMVKDVADIELDYTYKPLRETAAIGDFLSRKL